MSPPVNWHKCLVLLGLALSARTIGCDYSSITEKFGAEAVARCSEKCPFQNRTGEGHFDVNCGSDCSVEQCRMGCSLWLEGLDVSCQSACNVTSETALSRELYCVMGCNEALNTYFQMIKDLIGTPPAPALVADSLTATSLSLVWEGNPKLGNLTYLVQWRYEELPGSWQYYSNSSHSDRSIIHVENLRPYTKYRFRLAIFLSGRNGAGEPVYSAPSVVILTSDSGKPSSAPASLRAAAPDSSRVAISWEPGPFPNGQIISYVLRLADTQPNTIDVLEDMPASNKNLFYMFQNLAPARQYNVSVAMRNAVGEGPRAYVLISTPSLPTSVPSQQPILILGGEHNILAASANDMLSDPVEELYSTEHIITGVGVDVSSDNLFISVSNGFVYKSSLSKKSPPEAILSPKTIDYKPLDLSVDWLNQHLYVLGEVYYYKGSNRTNSSLYPSWIISRCDFDGKNGIVASSGFNSRPIHFEVDAYNGYLFWALRGIERGGLYRLDLANISNGVKHDCRPKQIVYDANLGAFTVDHADFRLLVTHIRRNTVLAVSLDGREVSDFRSNTQRPMFFSPRSIAYANGLFYWTNGNEILMEEYHPKRDSYFHNEYPVTYNTKTIAMREVLVALRSCQPIPVPVNPPLGVQAVMGINRAKISWSAPHLLGHQGTGAWQQWTFHLQLTNVITGETIGIKNINETTHIVDNIEQDTQYVIRIAAVTQSGSGPWSSEFIGKTLKSSPTTLQSTLLWSGPDGLLQTDLTGDNLQTLIDRNYLELQHLYITDISWYRDQLYLVTNASTVMWYNSTTHGKGFMPNMNNVGSLAVDWVGKKIYWSNPKQQLITRSNFDGSNKEPVPIVTVAKELTIDSLGAYIYWNTGHAVEAARLNGENKIIYYPAQLFSGKQVMGLTADLENKWLYWLVRSYDGSELHRAVTADKISLSPNEVTGTLVSRLSGTATLGPLCYFSERLVWVQDASRAVVSDLAGKYTAELIPRVHVIAVRDPTLHANSESIIAIPETINVSTIAVEGTWDKFNVTWAPASKVNVNSSRVYYDVSLSFPTHHKIEKTVVTSWVEVSERSIDPYSAVEVSVRAHTQWGGGAAARARLRTPQAQPSAPATPRLYVHRHSDGSMRAIFRWGSPRRSNGIVRGYEAQCWAVPRAPRPATPSACAPARLAPHQTQLVLTHLQHNTTYYFQVRAFTDAGYGQYSEIVSAFSDEINPIPKVMISSQESIKIIDLGTGDSEIIPKSTGIPLDFAIDIEENVAYWVNDLEEIFSSRINGSGHYKLTSINGTATSICVDWVSRSVYWSQLERASIESHVVYRADLGLPNTSPRIARVLKRHQRIHSLQVVPSMRSLFWYEESSHTGFGTLLTSHVNGSNVRPFFNYSDSSELDFRDDCNCPENPQIAKSFVIDLTNDIEIFFIDPWLYRIVATDITGCHCRVVVDATEKKKYGFIPMSLTVDSKYIYWYNSSERSIFYTNKFKKNKIDQVKSTFGYKIMALDVSNQPYPPRPCLFPNAEKLIPRVLSNSANSIKMQMPIIIKPNNCTKLEYEMTLTEYTVLYRLHSLDTTPCDRDSCFHLTTTNTEIILNDLKPFTNYTVRIEVTNYYAKLHEMKPIIGPMCLLQTAAEAPTAPKNVTGTVLSPVLARVEWTPEPGLWYELHWRTDDSPSLPHRKEHNTFEVSEGGSAIMTPLSPSTLYTVWVRARSRHSAVSADSLPLRLRTFPPPAPISLKNATAYKLTVIWPAPTSYTLNQYVVQYSETGGTIDLWMPCTQSGNAEWSAKDLRPKTKYRFRLSLQYVNNTLPYFWPRDHNFVFETIGDVPGPPGVLRVEAVGEKIVRAWWAEPDPRGDPVTHYRIWGTPSKRIENIDDNSLSNVSELLRADLPADIDDELKTRIIREGLELLHNGTESYWLIGSGDIGAGYTARVQARNSYGWGELSPAGELHAAPLIHPARPHPAVLAMAIITLAVIVLAVALALFYSYNKRSKKKAALENQVTSPVIRRGPDVELATLRQLPIRHSTNILYNQGVYCPSDAELAALPHIRREQITLTKFLGSGAFGEVFEGHARQIDSNTPNTKVAVKTLRKGATEQEKTEFLKEAALMSNFKHEHILRLLGVCLDNDPNYIIMELMEGGDLLSYLRAKRASLGTPESLTLLDLLNMCVDVTKGCRYLEEMHFVHRDLACRNCLVAVRDGRRIVKIGDFGLARDIYKNDYYRKEGEGLLPVRWMAVECLVDGVFSCQSDVWAWGVLCWEVLSLGQQPYPGRTNRQVLGYVRAGGTPDRPPNCPHSLYELLQKCWSYAAEARPSFRQCLRIVTSLRDITPPDPLPVSPPETTHHYLQLLGDDAVDNRTYLLDENDNALDEDLPEQQMEPSHLLPQRTPKYLELMYDSDSPPGTICDGYEIPRSPLSYAPFSRHSIVGVAPNRLIKPPLYRTHSLRTNMRPPNATIIPLRNGIVKRASLCEGVQSTFLREPSSSRSRQDFKQIKTPL
ncbi:proto-oncogene tyrosine-protein kinase ROS isoform X2 [Pieris brassicae]|uniref:proto-oncogene tyrosine-protein kinase ROS isoform X2 n=1 Tax=Pieris brassicae TaxID=7116 RepID=UPI001E660D13|nr:proto-oncogene tyrosine-protein kinase ROS isoform X2 [Pieris brassicae]